jgi:hypothetical protein
MGSRNGLPYQERTNCHLDACLSVDDDWPAQSQNAYPLRFNIRD